MSGARLTGAVKISTWLFCCGLVLLVVLLGCDPLIIDIVPASQTQDQGDDDQTDVVILTIDTIGQGEVRVDPTGNSFKCNTKIRLAAVPRDGWEFSHWEGDIHGEDPVVTVTMDRNKHVTAVFAEVGPDMVELQVLPVGYGSVVLDPGGVSREDGELYPRGTTVTLSADPDGGWVFLGYYDMEGGLLADTEEMDLVLGDSMSVVAKFGKVAPPPPPVYWGCTVMGADLQFLGVISDDPFWHDSLANPYGPYGDEFSLLSIWNSFGAYGSVNSELSAYDPFAENPPSVYFEGEFQGYLTTNPDFAPRFDPDEVAAAIGRYDVIRN